MYPSDDSRPATAERARSWAAARLAPPVRPAPVVYCGYHRSAFTGDVSLERGEMGGLEAVRRARKPAGSMRAAVGAPWGCAGPSAVGPGRGRALAAPSRGVASSVVRPSRALAEAAPFESEAAAGARGPEPADMELPSRRLDSSIRALIKTANLRGLPMACVGLPTVDILGPIPRPALIATRGVSPSGFPGSPSFWHSPPGGYPHDSYEGRDSREIERNSALPRGMAMVDVQEFQVDE